MARMRRLVFALLLCAAPIRSLCAQGLEEVRTEFERAPSSRTAAALVNAFRAAGQKSEAETFFARKPANAPALAAALCYGRGCLLALDYRWKDAMEHFVEAEKGFRILGDMDGLSAALQYEGMSWHYLGEMERAGEAYARSLEAERTGGDGKDVETLLNNLGLVRAALGDYAGALRLHEDALDAVRLPGNRRREAYTLHNIGTMHRYLGDYETALRFYGRAKRLREETGDREGLSHSLQGLGVLSYYTGDLSTALEHFARSAAIKRELGLLVEMADSLNNLALVHESLGDQTGAAETYGKALEIYRRTDNRYGIAVTLGNLGGISFQRGRYAEALSRQQESLALNEAMGDLQRQGHSCYAIGLAYERMDDLEQASRFLERGLAAMQNTGDLYGIGLLHDALAGLSLRKGLAEEALEQASRGIAIARGLGAPQLLTQAHASMGRACLRLGRRREALSHLQAAVDAVEDMRARLEGGEQREGFMETKISAYEELTSVLLEEPGSRAQAFAAAERMRARGFLEQMSGAHSVREGVPAGWTARRGLLEARIRWLRGRTAP
jgi:tetratricopeptide (TPR) repeat protein